MTISGNDALEVKRLLRQVGYTNTNGDPRPGYRTLHLITNMTYVSARVYQSSRFLNSYLSRSPTSHMNPGLLNPLEGSLNPGGGSDLSSVYWCHLFVVRSK